MNKISVWILGDQLLDQHPALEAALKETQLEQVMVVLIESAERIRQRLEDHMQKKGITLTCSIGVACWRLDGVMRGKIIEEADKAL